MFRISAPRSQRIARALALLGCAASQGEAVVWDKSAGTTQWSEPTNWDTDVEPDAASDVVFPAGAGLGSSITLTAGELARSLRFDAAYSLSSTGTLTLANGNFIETAAGVSATISTPLTVSGALTKTGNGILTLSGTNTLPNGTVISGGTLRINNAAALGAAGSLTRINDGTTLQLGAFVSLDRPLSLMQGGTLGASEFTSSSGTSSFGNTTIDAAAVSVTLAGGSSSQNGLTIGNSANDLTGGSAATVIQVTGPGGVTLGASSNYDGSWNIPTGGRLIVAAAGALGDRPASSVTLAGGTLGIKLSTETSFTSSPANRIVVTANSTLYTERPTVVTNGHTFGSLDIGSQALTVTPATNIPGMAFGSVNLSGNPVFAVNRSGSARGKLIFNSLLGGPLPRTITKTGGGDLTVSGGATDLAVGSTFSASGGGTLELLYPNLGPASVVTASTAQSPFGSSPIHMTDGLLRLRADGSNTTAAQVFSIPTEITLAGATSIELGYRTNPGNQNKTFDLTALTLAADSVLNYNTNFAYKLRIGGALPFEGNATLQNATSGSLLTLAGGISGGPGSVLTISGVASATPNLVINGASTYGGGTILSNGNVSLGAASALGSGLITVNGGALAADVIGSLGNAPLTVGGGSVTVNATHAARTGATTLNGGTLTLNAPNALGSGPFQFNGGTLALNQAGALPGTIHHGSPGTLLLNNVAVLAGNDLVLNGGLLEVKVGDDPNLQIGSFTVSGSSELKLSRLNGGYLFVPQLDTTDGALLRINAQAITPYFRDLRLSGVFTLDVPVSGYVPSVTAITEGATPGTLVKSGAGGLILAGPGTHSGGTELIEGTLTVNHAAALGGGPFVIGATSGTAPATATFGNGDTTSDNGPNFPNDIVARAGSSGELMLATGFYDSVRWQGSLSLQRDLTFYNSNARYPEFQGPITGTGNLVFKGAGETFLTHASNSFTGNLDVQSGSLGVASDGALGNPANPVLLGSSGGSLAIRGSFATARTILLNGTGGLAVLTDQTFTMDGPLGGTAILRKGGGGILSFGPATDNSARGAAGTLVVDGTLLLRGSKNLGTGGDIELNGTDPRLEVMSDPDLDFPQSVSVSNGSSVTLRVDRAPGGSGINGRHRFSALNLSSVTTTVEGDHGYAASFGTLTVSGSSSGLTNDTGSTMLLGAVQGTSTAESGLLRFGGTGGFLIQGNCSQPGGGAYSLRKQGPGTLTFGTGISGFRGNWTIVGDGLVDLNGLTHSVASLNMDGTYAAAARLITRPAGTLEVAGTIRSTKAALFTGNLRLGSGEHLFATDGNPMTIDGPISGGAGASMRLAGVLRLTGAGNTFGPVTVEQGSLELGKTSGDGVGTGGVSIQAGRVLLLAPDQFNDQAPVSITSPFYALLDLAGQSERVGSLSIVQNGVSPTDSCSLVSTKAAGVLVLGSNLSLHNNTNFSGTGPRNVLITGSGSFAQATGDGTLDLGGVVRTVHVTSTTTGTRQALANATIETRIINGGILKTGPRTLYLTNPGNSFSGGIVVSQGLISTGGTGSFGSGPVTFSNAAGTTAGLDLGTAGGSMTNPLTIGGAGSFSLVYGGPIPQTLELGGGITLQKTLPVEVTQGTTGKDRTATLELSGTITDGAGSFGLSKTGNGTLKLGPANAYSGETLVGRGTMHVTGPGSLGDGAAPLRIDGGCAMFSTPFTLARDVTITASGGSIRCDSAAGIELAGYLNWGATRAASFGSGTTILTGTTAGNGALQLGFPTDFSSTAAVLPEELGWGHRLSLRGSAALPAGNLSFDRGAILELGNGNFSRGLGTGPGQFQMPTGSGGGWAAFGQDRIVNIGGNGQTIIWGQAAPAFLNKDGDIGSLFLGSQGGTHTLVFENRLDLDNGLAAPLVREIVTLDGPAETDARMTGDLVVAAPARSATLLLASEGTLAMDGNILGNIAIRQERSGTTRFNGDNDFPGDLSLVRGSWVFLNDASVGAPSLIEVESEGHLDASALASPLSTAVSGRLRIDGTVSGHVLAPAVFSGRGVVSGNLRTAPHSEFSPSTGGILQVGGEFTLAAGSNYNIPFTGDIPGSGFPQIQVAGNVNLEGHLRVPAASGIAPGQTMILALNHGTDPINGHFAGLPEDAALFIGGGLGLKITYQANGDGGLIGNDIGATVIDWSTVSDRTLVVAAPLAVGLGQEITLSYTLGNAGPATVTHGRFLGHVPPGSEFLGSTPSGTFDNATTLRVPLPDLLPGGSDTVVMRFLAPSETGSLQTAGSFQGDGPDPDGSDPAVTSVVAVLPGGRLELREIKRDPLDGSVNLTVASLPGVHYLLEASVDLFDWQPVEDFHGTGELLTLETPAAGNGNHEFFRLRLIPFEDPGPGQ